MVESFCCVHENKWTLPHQDEGVSDPRHGHAPVDQRDRRVYGQEGQRAQEDEADCGDEVADDGEEDWLGQDPIRDLELKETVDKIGIFVM